jgi:glycosyltransferase involved in cell wall biosynthesis
LTGNSQISADLERPGPASAGRPLHVLTLTPFYPSREDAVDGCFVAEPLEALAKGVVSTVLALQPFYRARRHTRETEAGARWLRYFSLPGAAGLAMAGAFLFARIVGEVRELHRRQPIDLIHAHAPLPCGHAAFLLNSELKIPYVVSVHGLDVFSREGIEGRLGDGRFRISQKAYSSSRRVICISELVREQVLEGMGRTCRTSVVYNGVDPELFSPGALLLPDEAPVLSVGNLIPIKGQGVLIRAIAALAGEFPELVLEIIGDGPERGRLEDLAKGLGIASRVRFHGRQSRNEVVAAMRRCTVFALPSRYEGLGCVFLEAMSTEKPVIGCRGQGIAEIVQHGVNGFLVGPDNEKELTIALAMLMRDESLRRKLGSAARDTILDRLTLANQAESMLRIYRECAA